MTSPSSSITRKDPSEKEGTRRASDSSRPEKSAGVDDLELQLRGEPKVSKGEADQAELDAGKPPKLVLYVGAGRGREVPGFGGRELTFCCSP